MAILQLVQRGEVSLSDKVGTYLEGLATEIAEQVNIHHLLTGTSGMDAPMPDWQRVFHSRDEVHENGQRWARQATLAGVPGSGSNGHLPGSGVGLAMAAALVVARMALAWVADAMQLPRPRAVMGALATSVIVAFAVVQPSERAPGGSVFADPVTPASTLMAMASEISGLAEIPTTASRQRGSG